AARRALRRRGLAASAGRLRRALGARLRRPALRRDRRARRPARARAARRGRGAAAREAAPPPRPAPRALPAALLGAGGRARPGAPVPAAPAGGRALGRRRQAPQGAHGRGGRRPLERNLSPPARTDRGPPRGRGRARRRRARGRAPHDGGGDALVSEPWWISLIKAFVIVNLVMLAFAYTTLLERKLLGRMQLRYGPNRAGPYGSLQPIADLIKLIRKESFFPASAIDLPYIVAPAISVFTAIAAFSVIPFGAGWHLWHWHVDGEIANVSIALVLVFALGSMGVYGFIIGGWASESKFSLLGSMRTCAQLVSYEVSLALSVLGVVIMAGTLSLVKIVDNQSHSVWYVGPQIVGFLIFFIGGIAETNHAPFDLPEAETRLVAGYHTEYSGMRWGLFQMAEYVNMITL